jgi:DNA-binding response OmpR family regulator
MADSPPVVPASSGLQLRFALSLVPDAAADDATPTLRRQWLSAVGSAPWLDRLSGFRELTKQDFFDLLDSADQSRLCTCVKQLATSGAYQIEYTLTLPDGSRYALLEHARRLDNAHESPDSSLQAVAWILDVSSERALARSGTTDERALADQKADAQLQDRNILVVEVSANDSNSVAHHLSATGAKVLQVSSGMQALHALTADRFDLLITELHLPGFDGYGLAARVKVLRPGLPILVLAAHALGDERDRCIAAGGWELLAKPFARRELVAMANTLLADPRTQASAAGLRQRGAALSSSSARELPAAMVQQYRLGLKVRAQSVLELLAGQELAELIRLVHQLKGSAGGYGFSELGVMAGALETALKIHGLDPATTAACHAFADACGRASA